MSKSFLSISKHSKMTLLFKAHHILSFEMSVIVQGQSLPPVTSIVLTVTVLV